MTVLRIDPKIRFWAKVNKTETCWLWTGKVNKDGYGSLNINNNKLRANRVSWEFHNGVIPDGLIVCHHCDVPACVNPDHLFLGTHADNVRDKILKGRSCTGENKPNSKLTWAMVREIRSSGVSQTALAIKFGVAKTAIRHVLDNKTWKSKPPAALNGDAHCDAF